MLVVAEVTIAVAARVIGSRGGSMTTTDLHLSRPFFVARDGSHGITAIAAGVLGKRVGIVDRMTAAKASDSHDALSAFFVVADNGFGSDPVAFAGWHDGGAGRVDGIAVGIFLAQDGRFVVIPVALLPVKAAILCVEEEPDGGDDDSSADDGEEGEVDLVVHFGRVETASAGCEGSGGCAGDVRDDDGSHD